MSTTRAAAAEATAPAKQALAMRFTLLSAAVVTAMGVHNLPGGGPNPQVPPELELAAWQVRG